jgi:hypothetical protein
MISERLEKARSNLAKKGNARVYVVIEISPTIIVCLVVPKGAEHLPVANPMGSSKVVDDSSPDWGKVDQPTMCTIDVEDIAYPVKRGLRVVT